MATYSSTTSLAASPSPSSGSESPSRASGSRGSLPASASATKGLFYRADTTFNPAPYYPPQRSLPLYRPSALHPVGSTVFDAPQSTSPPFDGMFIHPPFNNLPEGVILTEGMSYSVMHQHPNWFLDIKDYITLDANPEGAVRYPRDLEPPRPRRQKDLLLRCTFCPRTYAGVNAKSMWTRHVREKHRVVLSKAWSDTATSSRRQSTGKVSPAAPLLLADTASTSRSSTGKDHYNNPHTLQHPGNDLAKPAVSAPLPKAKPPPAPKPAKPASPAKAAAAKKAAPPKKSGIPPLRIPASKPPPAPAPALSPVSRAALSPSPPPPEGILPPRMRPFPRKSFRPSQGPLDLKANTPESSNSTQPPTPALLIRSTSESEPGAITASTAPDRDSIASTPTDSTPANVIPDAASAAVTTSSSTISSDQVVVSPASDRASSVPGVQLASAVNGAAVDTPIEQAAKGSDDGESIETDQEVADLLLLDVDTSMYVDEPDEDVDMELEDEDEGLHPPIALGGLAEPMFGVENTAPDIFSLSSRPAIVMSPVFSPALSPEQSIELSSEQSVDNARSVGTPDAVELPADTEPPPLGHFKVSSLAYLMDKNLSVSPPSSPKPSSTPPPNLSSSSVNMEDEPPTATLFAAMQDVFVIQMKKMTPQLKEKFLGHLEEQFGIHVKDDTRGQMQLEQLVAGQSGTEHPTVPMAVDADTNGFGGQLAALADEFKQNSKGQLQGDLEDQLRMLVSQFTDEVVLPLQDALTLQLKDEIIVQVADQMLDALVVQGEEAQVEFEWRRKFLERQLWAEDSSDDALEEVIQHPLHHLFPTSKIVSSDMDVHMPSSLLC